MNPLYNRLMAEKGAPRAANAPNTTQLRSAPMNLQSAMQKYAYGGDVDPQNDPSKSQAMQVALFQKLLASGGMGALGTGSAPMGSGKFNVPPPEEISQTFMPNEGFNEPMPEEGYGGSAVPAYMGRSNEPSVGYGGVPGSEYGAIDAAKLATQNPPQATQNLGFSPDLPPSSNSGRMKSLAPVPTNFENSSISPELLRKIQESMGNPFGSQVTQQEQLMKLLQNLGMKK